MASNEINLQSIEYLAVVRTDGVLLAQEKFAVLAYDFESKVCAVASAPGLQKNVQDHATIADEGHHICIQMVARDGASFVAVAVCSPQFPKQRRLLPSADDAAQRLLPELKTCILNQTKNLSTAGYGSLTSTMRPLLRQLHAKYSSAAACGDKLGAAQEKVDAVKGAVIANMGKAIARGEKVEQLMDKSEHLNDSAGQFQRGSTALRRKMQCRYYKVLALLALVVLAIIAYVTVPLISASSD